MSRRLVPMLLAFTACGLAEPEGADAGTTAVELQILSLNPTSVYSAGTNSVTVRTENGCALADLTLSVGDAIVGSVQSPGVDEYVFTAPPFFSVWPDAAGCSSAKVQARVAVTCATPAKANARYAKNTAEAALTYEPFLEPLPTIAAHTPAGRGTPDAAMRVTFSRDIDPASVTSETFHIEGVEGEVSANADPRVFSYTPRAPLVVGTTYTCAVKTGASGLRATGTRQPICRTTLAPEGEEPDPVFDRWTFTVEAP